MTLYLISNCLYEQKFMRSIQTKIDTVTLPTWLNFRGHGICVWTHHMHVIFLHWSDCFDHVYRALLMLKLPRLTPVHCRKIIRIQANGTKARVVRRTYPVTLKAKRSASCWRELLMPGSSSRWARRPLPAKTTSLRGMIFTTRLRRADRELLRAPAQLRWWYNMYAVGLSRILNRIGLSRI